MKANLEMIPDALTPEQFFQYRTSILDAGEHRLILAILRDAIECFQKYVHAVNAKQRHLFFEAEAWIMYGDDEHPFSFSHVCHALGLDAQYVRAGLKGWLKEQRAFGHHSVAVGRKSTRRPSAGASRNKIIPKS